MELKLWDRLVLYLHVDSKVFREKLIVFVDLLASFYSCLVRRLR